VLRKVCALLGEVGRLLLAGEFWPLVWIEAVPAREVLAVEEGAEALGWGVGEERKREQAEKEAHLI
jgi:hypothetical protein